MKKVILFLLISSMLAVALYANGAQEVTPQTAEDGYMSVEAEQMQFKWRITDGRLEVEMSAMSTGWVAVGFDPSRVMKDANFIIGYVEGDEVTVNDQFGSGTFSHTADTELGGSNDIIEAEGREEDGRTVISFSIPLDSGDEYDTVLAAGQTHTILVACGPDGSDNFSKKHMYRAKLELQL